MKPWFRGLMLKVSMALEIEHVWDCLKDSSSCGVSSVTKALLHFGYGWIEDGGLDREVLSIPLRPAYTTIPERSYSPLRYSGRGKDESFVPKTRSKPISILVLSWGNLPLIERLFEACMELKKQPEKWIAL